MERKYFLKSLFVGTASVPALLSACSKADSVSPTSSSSGTTGSGSCTVAPTETEGPFPTYTPSAYVRSNITDGKTGYALTINISVTNSNASCAALAGALVDIWHCDAEGNYSEYGGSGMQATNYTGAHFLRGRQVTNAAGQVTFTSIFPGWYSGRATHVHVYSASGTSLKVWDDSYREFRMQAQHFNPDNRHHSFGELLHYVPNANRLHFLVSGAVRGCIRWRSRPAA